MFDQRDAGLAPARQSEMASTVHAYGVMDVSPRALQDAAATLRDLAAQAKHLDPDGLEVSATEAGNRQFAQVLAASARRRHEELATLIADLNRQADGLEAAARNTQLIDGHAARELLDSAGNNNESARTNTGSGKGN